jgi:hypothetical protein
MQSANGEDFDLKCKYFYNTVRRFCTQGTRFHFKAMSARDFRPFSDKVVLAREGFFELNFPEKIRC